MAITYIGLGSNLGNLEANLQRAVAELKEQIGTIRSQSALFRSVPWGFDSPNQFLNQVVALETPLTPLELLDATQTIELTIGRTTKSSSTGYADRLIDLDILLYNDLILESERLTIPHPLILQRDFVLYPLQEIAPEVLHPCLGVAIGTLELQQP